MWRETCGGETWELVTTHFDYLLYWESREAGVRPW